MQAPMCRDCFTGTLRGDVTPAGTEETIHGIPTYIAQPPPGVQPSGTVVLITDAIGWKLLNTRALADAYAQRVPCTVYVPDFMNGHAIPERVLFLTEAHPAPTTSLFSRLRNMLTKFLTTLSLLPSSSPLPITPASPSPTHVFSLSSPPCALPPRIQPPPKLASQAFAGADCTPCV